MKKSCWKHKSMQNFGNSLRKWHDILLYGNSDILWNIKSYRPFYSKTKIITSKIFIGLILLSIAAFTGLFISLPIKIVYKLGLIIVPMTISIFVINPLMTLCLLILLRPELQLVSQAGGLKFFSMLTIVFAFFIFLLNMEEFDFCSEKLKYLYLLILISIVSLSYSYRFYLSLENVFKMFSYTSFYLLAFNLVKSKRDGIKLLLCFPLAAVLPLLMGFYQIVTGQIYHVSATGINRYQSFFGVANDYSRFLFVVFIASVASFLYYIDNKTYKSILSCMLVMLILNIGFLGIRAVWAMLFIALLIIFFYLPEIRKYIIRSLPFLSLALVNVVIKGFSSIVNPDRFKLYGDSIYWRIGHWKLILNKVIPLKPMWGQGIGVSVSFNNYYLHVSLLAHNDYLRILEEVGIIGFIPFVLFIISNMVSWYRDINTYKENRAFNVCAFALFSSFAIAMMVSNIFLNVGVMWYILGYLGIIHKLNYLARVNKQQFSSW